MRLLSTAARKLLGLAGYELRRPDVDMADEVIARYLADIDRPVIFDVGANEGQTAVRFKALFPVSEIHAFEPSATFETLRSRTAHLSGVHLNACGVGSEPGSLALQEHSVSHMNSFLTPGADCWTEVEHTRTVPITTIDAYCQQHAIAAIDLLKTDTQGFDEQVMRGAGGMIARRAVRLIYTELIFSDLYRGQASAPEYMKSILDAGYALVGLYEFGTMDDRLGWCDALFIRTGTVPGDASH